MANCNNCIKNKDCCSMGKMSGFCGGYSPAAVTNREYFFGERLIADSIMLLTYDDHPREECRLFKQTLKEMTSHEIIAWLDAEKDRRFSW